MVNPNSHFDASPEIELCASEDEDLEVDEVWVVWRRREDQVCQGWKYVGKGAVEKGSRSGQRKVTVEKGEAAKRLPRMSANVSTSISRQREHHNASRITMKLAFKIYRVSEKDNQKVASVAAAMCLALTLSMPSPNLEKR